MSASEIPSASKRTPAAIGTSAPPSISSTVPITEITGSLKKPLVRGAKPELCSRRGLPTPPPDSTTTRARASWTAPSRTNSTPTA